MNFSKGHLIQAVYWFRIFKASRRPRTHLFNMNASYSYEQESYMQLFLAAEAGELELNLHSKQQQKENN